MKVPPHPVYVLYIKLRLDIVKAMHYYLTEVVSDPAGPTSTEKLVRCVVSHSTVLLLMSFTITPSVDHPPLKLMFKYINFIGT